MYEPLTMLGTSVKWYTELKLYPWHPIEDLLSVCHENLVVSTTLMILSRVMCWIVW
jgi:hypothetical protein